MGKLKETWAKLKHLSTLLENPRKVEPIVEESDESPDVPELSQEQILEQLLHKLRQPREVVLITINEEVSTALTPNAMFLQSWSFASMFKHTYDSTLLQHLVAAPWRFNTQGGGTVKRCRLKLGSSWAAWLVSGIPKAEDLAPTEVYLRFDTPDQPMVNPVTQQATKLHNDLVSTTCLLLGCRIVESRYFKGGYIYRLESAVKYDFYRTFVASETDDY